jgi:hypothetical protein
VTQEPREPGTDVIGEIQRWLVRSGTRGVSRELSGQFRSAFGRGRSADVWESATTLPQDEAPECAWCPVCRAARRLNESGPGLASHVAVASDALATVAQGAMSAFEAAMAAARPVVRDATAPPASGARDAKAPPASGARDAKAPPASGARDDAHSPASGRPDDADSPASGRGVWDDAVSAPAEGPPREPDDRR